MISRLQILSFYISFDFIIYYQKLEEIYLILVISQKFYYYFLSIYYILDSHYFVIYQKFVHNVKSHKIRVQDI